LDFGSGPVSQIDLTVPAGGTARRTTTGAAPILAEGWGLATSTEPVSGMILFQASRNGTPFWDVSAVGTGPTYFYTGYANENLGLAMVNPSASIITLRVAVRAANGTAPSVGPWNFQLDPKHHTRFNLFDLTGFPRPFEGSVTITGINDAPIPFAAFTLNFREGLINSLPQGEMQFPGPPDRRPYDIAYKIRRAGVALQPELGPLLAGRSATTIANLIASMGLVVDTSPTILASYNQSDNTIHLTTALIEMMGASDAALAFIIAHKAAHGVFLAVGTPPPEYGLPTPEQYADVMASLSLLKGGFDGFGGGDFLARLQMVDALSSANIDSSFRAEFELPNGIAARLHALADNVDYACDVSHSTAALHATCDKARQFWYPESFAIAAP
jgi:hypothetical protein